MAITKTTFCFLISILPLISADNLRTRAAGTTSAGSPTFSNYPVTSDMPSLSPAGHFIQQSENVAPFLPQKDSEVAPESKRINLLAAVGDIPAVEALLNKQPFWIMARDNHGWTALHEAARSGSVRMIDFLLDHGAELNALTYNGATPLYVAESYNGKDAAVVHYLLSLGALRKEAKAQLRGGSSTATNEELIQQRVPQTLAAEGRMDELNELVDVKGRWVLDVHDENGWTPLHEAARSGHVHVARFLIEHGVDRNSLSNEGASPLYYAKEFHGRRSKITRYLLSQEASEITPR